MSDKVYLGDGAYILFDGYALILTTEDGVETTNEIVLEPQVVMGLFAFVEKLKKMEKWE
jgi:hypothetical protein